MTRHRTIRNSRTTNPAASRPVIALLTDFGYSDHYVGTVKGVIASIAPDAHVIDISHGIPPQDVQSAAYALWAAYRFFPGGTIFVPVVDPGVGSERGVRIVWNRKYLFVHPENGILDLVLAEEGAVNAVEVRVDRSPLVLGPASATFHGRDVFAPLAAYLSKGVNPESLGRKIRLKSPSDPFISSTSQHRGRILYRDHFGNCITNIRNGLMSYIKHIAVGGKRISHVIRFYAEASGKNVCLIKGSNGLIEMCAKNGSAAEILGLRKNQAFSLRWK